MFFFVSIVDFVRVYAGRDAKKNIESILEYNYLLQIIFISTFNYLENVSKKYEMHSNYLAVAEKQKLYDKKLHFMTNKFQ